MQNSNSNEAILNVTAELEQRLDAARKEKTLAQVPALRRLRMVVRGYVVLGALGQLAVIPVGMSLRNIYDVIGQVGLGFSSYVIFGLYCVAIWISMAVGWLLLLAYASFRFQPEFAGYS